LDAAEPLGSVQDSLDKTFEAIASLYHLCPNVKFRRN